LHVELNSAPSEDALKYYDDNNISFIVMTLNLAGVRNLLNKLVKASTLLWRLAKKGNSLVSTFHVYGILLKSYISFLRAQQNISELEGAKLALVGFDYLFPTGLALALQARGIKLAAVQERVVHVFDNYFHPVFDTYFISGPTIRDRLKKNPFYCIGEMPIVGLVRAELLKNMLDDKTHDGERMVLVLDFHSNPDEFADFFNPLVSWQANHEFYLDILRLAENHLDIQFVIRGKNDAWCSIPYFADVLLKINAAPNVKVNHQYDKIGVSYNLTALTDLVIARQTSLGDEALAVGIPVLFHDWHTQRKFNVSTICDYNGYDIYTHDFETLSARVDAFFMENIYLPHDVFMAMRSEFYAEPINNTKNMVLNHLKMILNCR
jgi:hypothetical protein